MTFNQNISQGSEKKIQCYYSVIITIKLANDVKVSVNKKHLWAHFYFLEFLIMSITRIFP